MIQSPPNGRLHGDHHEATIRNVVDLAHEVRIHLNDERVIFGSVAPRANEEIGSFRIRPWGHAETTTFKFGDVSVAAPVKQMGWERYRSIASAQKAGNFMIARRPTR